MSSTGKDCPYCHQNKTVYRNGWNKLSNGNIIQKWYCSKCDKSFQ